MNTFDRCHQLVMYEIYTMHVPFFRLLMRLNAETEEVILTCEIQKRMAWNWNGQKKRMKSKNKIEMHKHLADFSFLRSQQVRV